MTIEAMKQALGALENAEAEGNCEYGATDLLRSAIKTAEQHEPVAWITKWSHNGSRGTVLGYKKQRHHGDVEHIPLYTTPPAAQRQWVGLTEDEIAEWDYDVRDVVMDIEKLLREKNT